MKRVNKQTEVTPGDPDSVRFGATIHPGPNAGPNWMEKLEVDRLPDAKGQVRALVTAADCVRLLNMGLEVRLQRAYPVEPLNPKLIQTDEAFRRELDEKLKTVKR